MVPIPKRDKGEGDKSKLLTMEGGHPNGSFHHQSQNSTPVHNSLNGARMQSDSSDPDESSKLDHALLESLFYNEMMMLDASSSSSSALLSHLSEATHPVAAKEPPVAVDPKTIAEKEMLQDFGVSTGHPPPTRTEEAPWQNEPSAVKTAAAAAAAAPPQSTHTSIPLPLVPLHSAAPVASIVASAPTSVSPNVPVTKPNLTIEAHPTAVSQERAQQLVDQFATLASRLGISLPTNVLQSLTAAAVRNETEPDPMEESTPTESDYPLTEPATAQMEESDEAEEVSSSSAVAPTVEELRKTAEEAIAAVSKKRPSEDQASAVSTNKPLYSKRRKKPRLSDCESRLAELRAENELLKRHLQNVSNKAHRFDQEKEEAGKRIGQLHMENINTEDMAKAIKEFSDMYSDYGVTRQQELSFHLEQLQRCASQ